jgi:hypothetical protein
MSGASTPVALPRSPAADGLIVADEPGSATYGPSCASVTPMLTDMYQVRAARPARARAGGGGKWDGAAGSVRGRRAVVAASAAQCCRRRDPGRDRRPPPRAGQWRRAPAARCYIKATAQDAPLLAATPTAGLPRAPRPPHREQAAAFLPSCVSHPPHAPLPHAPPPPPPPPHHTPLPPPLPPPPPSPPPSADHNDLCLLEGRPPPRPRRL